MQQTRDLTDRQAYYKHYKESLNMKKHWRKYCNTLDKTSKIGRVCKTVRKMSAIETKTSILTPKEGDLVYDNNQSKIELFANKFASVSSNSNRSAEFLTQRANTSPPARGAIWRIK